MKEEASDNFSFLDEEEEFAYEDTCEHNGLLIYPYLWYRFLHPALSQDELYADIDSFRFPQALPLTRYLANTRIKSLWRVVTGDVVTAPASVENAQSFETIYPEYEVRASRYATKQIAETMNIPFIQQQCWSLGSLNAHHPGYDEAVKRFFERWPCIFESKDGMEYRVYFVDKTVLVLRYPTEDGMLWYRVEYAGGMEMSIRLHLKLRIPDTHYTIDIGQKAVKIKPDVLVPPG